MKLKLFGAIGGIFLLFNSLAQISEGGLPLSFGKVMTTQNSPFKASFQEISMTKPNVVALKSEDALNDTKGAYRVGVNLPVSYNTLNSGTWMQLADGTKVWRLKIKSKDAMALGLYFSEKVQIPAGAKLFAYNSNRKQLLGAYTSATEQFQAMEMVQGEELTLEYNAASWVTQQPVIQINEVVYFYRGVEEHVNQFSSEIASEKAQSCEVDVACSEGTNWQNQIKSVVHYTFNDGTGTYVCSGATINNTSQNCKPYILTAWHCGERVVNQTISTWVWYWKYQKASCSPGSANSSDPGKGSSTMTGGTVRCSSGNGTLLNNPPVNQQVAGSDFYLVELNSQPPASYNVFYAGWNRTNTAATSGVGIHHPFGSAKKISTYTAPLTSGSFNGGSANSHWSVVWTATANGHGVTEGGSSGSPLFDQNGRIVGQLSGGGASCSSPTSPDVYGKMYKNWDLNGTTLDNALKFWLDPTNTGLSTLDGVTPPCSSSPTAPVANFIGNPTTVTINGTVQFTDQSTGTPTSWSWSIAPATGWSYTGGTSATSQNPQVTFTTVGVYTITLTATNAQGSDQEIKTNYITVTASTSPCTATSTTCEEYIAQVQLGSINNLTACANYASYAQSTTLTKGQSYSITIIPQITGQAAGTAYTGDELAAWIDFNGDLDFDDAGEQIAFISIGGGSTSLVFPFTCPAGAITGTVKMRVRMVYNGAQGDGPITPCGTSQFGEVEDYNIVIISGTSAGIEVNPLANIHVYPNPFGNKISVDLGDFADTPIQIELMDMTGKTIQIMNTIGGNTIDLGTEHLAKGMYQIRLSNGTLWYTTRIVKN